MKTFLLFCILCANLHADPLPLGKVVSLALENSPETKKAWWNARRAQAALGQASATYAPKVDFEATAVKGKTFKYVNGPDVPFKQVGLDLSLSWLLFDFGQRCADVEACKLSLQAANWQSDWEIQKVMLSVLKNCYSVLNLQEEMQYLRLSLQDAEKMLFIAQELNKVGLKPITDVYSSKSVLSRLQIAFARKKALLDTERGKLCASCGLDVTEALELAPVQHVAPRQKTEYQKLLALAKETRQDLMAKQAQLKESFAFEDKARAGYLPKLRLDASTGINHYLHDKTEDMTYRLGLTLTVPLFSGFDTLYRNRKMKAETNISMQELAALELEIALEVLRHNRQVEECEEVAELVSCELQNAELAYTGLLETYRAGKERAIVDVSAALRELVDARISYSKVKSDWLVAIANLAYATGGVCTTY